jgi:hypothetical protein
MPLTSFEARTLHIPPDVPAMSHFMRLNMPAVNAAISAYEALHYAVFSILLSPHVSSVQI